MQISEEVHRREEGEGNLISQKETVYFPLCKPLLVVFLHCLRFPIPSFTFSSLVFAARLVAFALPALSYSLLLAPASSSSCLLWLNPPCNSSIFECDDDGSVESDGSVDDDGGGDVDGGDVDGGGGDDGGGGVDGSSGVMAESSLQLVHLQQGRQGNQTLQKTLHPQALTALTKPKIQAISPEHSQPLSHHTNTPQMPAMVMMLPLAMAMVVVMMVPLAMMMVPLAMAMVMMVLLAMVVKTIGSEFRWCPRRGYQPHDPPHLC